MENVEDKTEEIHVHKDVLSVELLGICYAQDLKMKLKRMLNNVVANKLYNWVQKLKLLV